MAEDRKEEGEEVLKSGALWKMSGSWKKNEGRRREGRMKVQNASVSLESTPFLLTKLFFSGMWVKRRRKRWVEQRSHTPTRPETHTLTHIVQLESA